MRGERGSILPVLPGSAAAPFPLLFPAWRRGGSLASRSSAAGVVAQPYGGCAVSRGCCEAVVAPGVCGALRVLEAEVAALSVGQGFRVPRGCCAAGVGDVRCGAGWGFPQEQGDLSPGVGWDLGSPEPLQRPCGMQGRVLGCPGVL